MTEPLTAVEYRALVSQALDHAVDADTRRPNPQTLFMPDSHRSALYVDITLVQGGRGVGKTFWCRSLLDDTLREAAADEYQIARLRRLHVAPGYGLDRKSDCYPPPLVMRSLAESPVPAYDIWFAVLLTALGQPELQQLDWRDKLAWVSQNAEAAERTIEQVDEQAYAENKVHLLLFDALEHLHTDREKADELVGGLLQLALQMRFSTRNIRFKIFIRPDMYDSARRHFPDASKLSGRAAELTWARTDLYGLLFQYLGNQEGEGAARFRHLTGGWTSDGPDDRHVPPLALRNEEQAQTDLFERIADPFMGGNHRKGRPYTWLPNHLMDGREQISPRSFLKALAEAADHTGSAHPGHEQALHHEGIRKGVQAASRMRVEEVCEDTPWVQLAIEPLSECQVPVEEEKVLSLWKQACLTDSLAEAAARYAQADDPAHVHTGPRQPDDLPRVIEELITLGVMRRRRDGRLDLPDVYRIAFGLGRRGGVPRVSR